MENSFDRASDKTIKAMLGSLSVIIIIIIIIIIITITSVLMIYKNMKKWVTKLIINKEPVVTNHFACKHR